MVFVGWFTGHSFNGRGSFRHFFFVPSQNFEAVIAQLGERQTEDLKVPCSIHGHGNFAWMNSEGSGHGLQIHGGLTSQWFESTLITLIF